MAQRTEATTETAIPEERPLSDTDGVMAAGYRTDAGLAVSFFCPAYMDEENLPRVVRRGVAALEKLSSRFEWFIIDDASPDHTAETADVLAAEIANVTAIHNPRNLGHGGALKKGFSSATLEWIGFCDGDDQYDPCDIALMIPHFPLAHAVIGRRTNYPNGTRRKAASFLMNAIIRWLFGVPYRDLGCSFKFFRKDTLPLASPRSDGIFAQCEMVLRAHRAGLRIVEADIPAYPRVGGKSSSITPSSVAALARDMLSLWREFHLR